MTTDDRPFGTFEDYVPGDVTRARQDRTGGERPR